MVRYEKNSSEIEPYNLVFSKYAGRAVNHSKWFCLMSQKILTHQMIPLCMNFTKRVEIRLPSDSLRLEVQFSKTANT